MIDFFQKEIFWNALTSVGTIFTVISSLYFSNKTEKEKRRLDLFQQVTEYSNGDIEVLFTIENIGNRSIIINDIGLKLGKTARDRTTHKYVVKKDTFPLQIKPTSADIIRYFINKGSLDYSRLKEQLKQRNNNRFVAFDTRNTMH